MTQPSRPSSKPAPDDLDGDSDSARAFLESLERQRGTPLLTEADYQETRGWLLAELARGPRVAVSTLLTFSVVGLILFGFLLVGIHTLLTQEPADWDWLLAAASAACLLLWSYLLRQYLTGIHRYGRMPINERLNEIEELRQSGLISREEFDALYAAIHSCRGRT